MHHLQPEGIEINSSGDEEEVDQDLLEWGEAGKIFGLLEGTDEIDEQECRRVVEGIKLLREGIAKQIEGLKLQEGLAIVHWASCWMQLWWDRGVVIFILQLPPVNM